MKIYPAPHEVSQIKKPRFLDIPVSHIEKEYIPDSISVELEPDFAEKKEIDIEPYHRFNSDDKLLFDKNNNLVDIQTKREDGKYTYIPKNITEFAPDTFSVSAVVKKSLYYTNSNNYNLNVGIYEQGNNEAFAKKMIAIFGDAPYRGICPSNITVNNGFMQPDSMIKDSTDNLDFFFAKTYDGYYTDSSKSIFIDIAEILDKHVNVWISINNACSSSYFNTLDQNTGYMFNIQTLYNKTFEFENYIYTAVDHVNISAAPESECTYHHKTLFDLSPVLIIEKPEKGFLIISHEEMLNNPEKYAQFIYEIMMYVYTRAYKGTRTIESWITDQNVDYLGTPNNTLNRNHKKINLTEMLNDLNLSTYNYDIIGIDIKDENNNVIYHHKDNQNNLYFSKLALSDPLKKSDQKSIFTTRRTVLFFQNEGIKEIESSVQIGTNINENNECSVTVEPFISSSKRIIVDKSVTFTIDDITETYCIIALPVNEDNISTLFMINEKEYNYKTDLLVAKVKVNFIGEDTAYDVRILGGGLPEKYTDYEMLDISNIKGRPYRIGVSAIIKLPKELKEYDDIISDAIEKHKVAADIFFTSYATESLYL